MEETLFLEQICSNPNKNFLITGEAGTGKTSLLLKLVNQFQASGIKYRICAPTGIAAVNCNGATIHSTFGINPFQKIDEPTNNYKSNAKSRWIGVRTIIIDEISMVSKKLFMQIETALQNILQKFVPMGGVQLVVFGDFLQLPPIIKNNFDGDPRIYAKDNLSYAPDDYIFTSDLWRECKFSILFLKRIYRQTDNRFIRILREARLADLCEQSIHFLIQRVVPFPIDELETKTGVLPTFLYGTKKNVLVKNTTEFNKLNSPIIKFKGVFVWRDMKTFASLPASYITKDDLKFQTAFLENIGLDYEFELREGAQIMIRANIDVANRLCNGSRGVVRRIVQTQGKEGIEIETPAGTRHFIFAHSFERYYYTGRKILQFTILPVCLAWAMTIHKAQGLSIDSLALDLSSSNIFTQHQAYVALSRATHLEGVYLSDFDPQSFKLDDTIANFVKELETNADFSIVDNEDERQFDNFNTTENGIGVFWFDFNNLIDHYPIELTETERNGFWIGSDNKSFILRTTKKINNDETFLTLNDTNFSNGISHLSTTLKTLVYENRNNFVQNCKIFRKHRPENEITINPNEFLYFSGFFQKNFTLKFY